MLTACPFDGGFLYHLALGANICEDVYVGEVFLYHLALGAKVCEDMYVGEV